MDDKVPRVSLLFLKLPSLLYGGLFGTSGCGCTVLAGTYNVKKYQKKGIMVSLKRSRYSLHELLCMDRKKDPAVSGIFPLLNESKK